MSSLDVEDFFTAVAEGDRARVEEMVSRDPALLEALDPQGRSGLLVAVYHGHHDLVNLLTERRPATDICEAAASGRVGRVRDLLRDDPGQAGFHSSDGFSPLGLAAFFGHAEVVEVLLEFGADPAERSRNAMNVTPLHSAAAHGDPTVALRLCELLLEREADPALAQTGGWRPLHQAASHGNLPLAELLVRYGADPSAESDDGRTPVDMAREGGHDEVASFLEAL